MILQRALVGAKLRLKDQELDTKYTFPFVDRDWRVPFFVADILGRGPRVLHGSLRMDSGAMVVDREGVHLTAIEGIPLEDFERLVHFDPWWDFRGVGGVRREWIETVIASNVARPFVREGAVHKIADLEFDDRLETLRAVVAKDDRFRPARFLRGSIDLYSIRRPHPATLRAAGSR